MFGFLGTSILYNMAESFVDNVIRDTVHPKIGSIVYCDLAFGNAEHSGIYIGDNKIVHLDGSGLIETVSPEKFLARLGGINTARSIYVSCNDNLPVGCTVAAQIARSSVGERRKYNLLLNNCHQFTSGCISGNLENSDSFLWMLKKTAESEISANTWRVWARK